MNRERVVAYLLQKQGCCPSGWPRATAAQGVMVQEASGRRERENQFVTNVTIERIFERLLSTRERTAYTQYCLAARGEEISTLQREFACSRATAYRRLRNIEKRLQAEYDKFD